MFYIQVSNGLLKDGHRKRMGEAVWEFMWCLDRMTSINEQGIGLVLGGRPINLEEIADSTGVHINTVSRNLSKLTEHKYISVTRTPYGLIIRVHKAQKRFKRRGKTCGQPVNNRQRESPFMVERITTYGESNNVVRPDKDIISTNNRLKINKLRQLKEKIKIKNI